MTVTARTMLEAAGLADALCAEYEVTREQALADVEEFLATLRKYSIT